jgi:predicted DsbA family dithiol-disulfide isomerase
LRATKRPGIFRALPEMIPVPVVLFSDFTCPFSYVTEAGLARMEEAGEARVTTLPWELYPAPYSLPPGDGTGCSLALEPIAAELDVPFGEPPVPARTRKAHEAAAFAASRGAGPAFRAAVFAAHFVDGRDIGRLDVLAEIASAVGLDASEARVVLDVDTFTARVAGQVDAARRAGVEETPTLVAGEGDAARWWVGARPFGELRRWVLESG